MAAMDPVLPALGWGGRSLEGVQQKCRRRQGPWACFRLSAVLATSVGCPAGVESLPRARTDLGRPGPASIVGMMPVAQMSSDTC